MAIAGRKLIIEIKVTHGVDDEKLIKIHNIGIPAIEIDLSDLPRDINLVDLERHVVSGINRKKWLFYPTPKKKRAYNIPKNLPPTARTVRPVYRRGALHIDYCPIARRTWRGKPYANVRHDCVHCRYRLAIGPGMSSVTCAAFNISSAGNRRPARRRL